MFLGFIGVLCFSASLPFTQVAVREFGVIFPSFGRAVIAAALALIMIRITRTPRPARSLWPRLAMVIGGVVRTGARPSRRYWAYSSIGAIAIAVLTASRGTADLALGDLYLLGAVVCAAVGYTEGAIISREIGGWQTISWAVIGALPLTIPLTLIGLRPVGLDDPATAWMSLAYLGVVSMYFGFFVWYAGLALGGIARVSQIQLLQPMLSLMWAAIFLSEQLDALIVIVALVVLVSVAGSRRSAIDGSPDPSLRVIGQTFR